MSLIKFKINNKDYLINSDEWEKLNNFIKVGKKRNKSLTEMVFNPKSVKNLDLNFKLPEEIRCENCGKVIEDRNNEIDGLCYRCYMRKYYNS